MSFNRTLLFIASLGLFTAAPASGASFTVDSNAESHDASPGDGVCADASSACTVRAAIEEANALAGPDSVSIPGGTVILQESLMIRDDLELSGAGLDVTVIDRNGPSPFPVSTGTVVDVDNGLEVVLRDLSLIHGDHFYGGGLTNRGSVTAISVGVRDNRSGGGIYNDRGARLVLQSCVISGNTAENVGGGVYNDSTITIIGSTIANNRTGNSGGGLHSEGVATVVASTFSGNYAGNVGGGAAAYGTLTVVNSTFSGNRAFNVGGGFHVNGFLAMNSSTVTGNIANGFGGGGIFVSDEEAGSALVRNSIVYANVNRAPDCFGNVVSGGNNVIGALTDCDLTPRPTDQIGVDPLLGPLQDNGGPTATHAIADNSTARDAGQNCDAADQRGVPRPQGPACDVGAYEVLACNFDGFVDPGEDCDDGNAEDHDGCTSLCQTEQLAGAALQISVGPRGKLQSREADKRVRLGWGNSSADDPVLHGASLRLRGNGGDAFDVVYDLPAANWKYVGKRGRNRGYRYTDKTGAIRSVVVQPRKKILVKGVNADSAMSMSSDPGPVDVVLNIGDRTYSATYGGVTRYRPGRDFRARNAPPAQMAD